MENHVEENVRTGQQTDYRIWETYFRSHWMMHFYGEKDYRSQLRDAVQGLLTILPAILTQTKDFEKAFLVVIESLRRALTEQLDWSLEDLGSSDSKLEAVEMKFIYAFYDLVAGTVCDSPEALARDVKKLVLDFKKEGGLAQYQ